MEIALIIEKCDEKPLVENPNIHIITQKEKNRLKRAAELYRIVRKLVKKHGYKKIFVRISKYAAMISCLAGHGCGAEVYYWLSGASLDFYKEKPIIDRVKYLLKDHSVYKAVTSMVDFFVTGPEHMVEYYAMTGKVRRGKIRLLYNDIDTTRFSTIGEDEKKRLRDELGMRSDAVVILLVHRYSGVRKTAFYIPYVLEPFRGRNDIEVILIGDGPDRDMVRDAIHVSDLGFVRMLDSQPNAIIQKYYQACDIFINPSWTEGFPRVIIEAMACGKPIVATDAGGTADLFGERQQPYVVEIQDREGFAEALYKMTESETIRKECGNENRKRVNVYDTENVADMYIRTIWDL